MRGVFEEGFKIVEKTFPIESTDVGICDSGYNFRIDKKYYREPVLCDDEELNESEFLTVWVD